ncbi:thiolase family protein [Desulfospira joergensenii]|uniref:thiolase family protein n=1 Tax=Desulfospira joergensenii TaxID=53329 RepID=UPI0003B5075B|nr:acetyl-CoA C-acetyltransferase [Desulfospira joergensenii]
MREVVIASACRTAIGRFGGTLSPLSDIDFGPVPIREAVQRAGLAGGQVDEVIYASGYRTGDLPINSARVVAVRAGIPEEKPQFTISKACAGSMKAVVLAAQVIRSGDGEIMVAGGMESMSNAAFMLKKARWGYRLGHGQLLDQLILFDPLSGNTMGETAENVAERYNISREDQDRFGLRSQTLAEKAIQSGRFREQIVPVEIPQRKGDPKIFDTDEHPRANTTMETLEKLKPPFKKGGSVTAGNSSGMNDGASALVVMSGEKARELGIEPMAGVVSYSSVGVDPAHMGIGPIPATRMALEKAGLRMEDMGLIELNEAFASQSLACIRELEMDMERVNVNGGAIALGHPVSASGGVILTKLLYEMKAREVRYGLATLCIGGGQGMALILERN